MMRTDSANELLSRVVAASRALQTEIENRRWLVMFDLEGVMETAFPPTDAEVYLSDPRFQYLGTVKELLA